MWVHEWHLIFPHPCEYDEDMYMRTVRTKRNGKIFEYIQLVSSVRVGTQVHKKILYNLGRRDDPHSLISYIHGQKNMESLFVNKKAKLYALPTAIYSICVNDLALSPIFQDVFGASKIRSNVLLFTILMIIHRIVDPDAKLALTRWYKTILLPVALPESLDVHNLYYTLDYLISKKEAIEKKLFEELRKKQFIETTIVFYDLTSSYFEGEDVEMAAYGYSRDHRPDCLQITLALVIDKTGLPIYHEVFSGNTQDKATVKGVLQKLQENFQIKEVIFVADKGMLTPDNVKELEEKKYQSILSESVRNSFSQKQREDLYVHITTLKKKADNLWYTKTEDKDGKDIIVCYNQYTAIKAKETRVTKLKRLQTFISETKEKHTGETDKKALQQIRDSILAKLVVSHARKYFDTKEKETLEQLFPLLDKVVKREEYMDGFWVVRSNTQNLTPEQVITTYKELKTIEASFRVIKDVIELRPIYHHKDDRVKGHVFICILAFLVTRLLEKKTKTTIKMLREEYMTAVALPTNEAHPEVQPFILGGDRLLQAVK
jgi:transposase